MTFRVINVHGFPGRGDVRSNQSSRRRSAERLQSRPGLVLVSAAERGVQPERWGLGIALRMMGPSISDAHLVIEAEKSDPAGVHELADWAASQSIASPAGPVPVGLITRSELCHRDTGILTTTCYTGAGWLLTGDEGRSLGLLADYWQPARSDFYRGGFLLGLPGWGRVEERTDASGRAHRGWRANLHRPPMRMKALGGHGLAAGFGRAGKGGRTPTGEPAGRWEKQRGGRSLPFLGRIVDLIGPAFAFDGIDSGEIAEHLVAFGLPPVAIPAAVDVDVSGASTLLAAAMAIHRLAVAVDAEASLWLTSPADRNAGRYGAGLQYMVSPGTLAAATFRRAGITPPLRKFPKPDDASLDRWSAGAHGGWTT